MHKRVERFVEHEAVTWLFVAVGVILVLISGVTMTGAVIGPSIEVTTLFIVGMVLFVAGLVLKFQKF